MCEYTIVMHLFHDFWIIFLQYIASYFGILRNIY